MITEPVTMHFEYVLPLTPTLREVVALCTMHKLPYSMLECILNPQGLISPDEELNPQPQSKSQPQPKSQPQTEQEPEIPKKKKNKKNKKNKEDARKNENGTRGSISRSGSINFSGGERGSPPGLSRQPIPMYADSENPGESGESRGTPEEEGDAQEVLPAPEAQALSGIDEYINTAFNPSQQEVRYCFLINVQAHMKSSTIYCTLLIAVQINLVLIPGPRSQLMYIILAFIRLQLSPCSADRIGKKPD
jgi:hypothetical protein